jgi:hypothetical protein
LSGSVNVCPNGKHDDPQNTGKCVHCGADPTTGPRIVYVEAKLNADLDALMGALGYEKKE